MSVFVSCGEPSGDVYAGDLIRVLRARGEGGEKVFGMLGKNGIEAGGEALWGYEALHLMGIVEVIPSIPRLFRLRNEIAEQIIARAPSAVVVIDSPDFHLPLIKKIRARGYKGKIIYLATPTVWAWRSGRARALRDFCDLCLPLFSFEHKWLVQHGINSAWKCHPLAGGVLPFEKKIQDERVIAFMPGSRSYDIRWHLDALLESAHKIHELGYLPVFSVAPGIHGELRERLISIIKENNFEMCYGEGRELLARAQAAVGVSGTISVEAMLLKRFMVVVYNGNFLSWLVWKLFIHTPYISMPNLIAPAPIFPELLSREMTSDNIVAELLSYLEDDARKEHFSALAAEAVASMGSGNAAEFWADEIENIAAPLPVMPHASAPLASASSKNF